MLRHFPRPVANITSCSSLLDGYTNCLDDLGDSGIADSCDVSFFAYENCVEDAVNAAPPHKSDILWCDGFYSAWQLCVTREGCTSACDGTTMSPSNCTEFASSYCSWASCCPPCELLVTDSYAKCAADGGGCTIPTCPSSSSVDPFRISKSLMAAGFGAAALFAIY